MQTYLALLILIRCCGPGSHGNGLGIYIVFVNVYSRIIYNINLTLIVQCKHRECLDYVCVFTQTRFCLFFFLNQCLLHCSWDTNRANRQIISVFGVKSNPKIIIFFIVFSFQQNKQYLNPHI